MKDAATGTGKKNLRARLEAYDLLFIVLMIFAAALRLYYFFLTKDQTLWWHEAEYMLKAKSLALGTPDTGYPNSPPALLSLLAAGLFKLGLGEAVIRFLWVALSTASLFFTYRIGALLFNKRVGFYAAALASVFYIDLFYSMRLLVDVPQVFFVLLAGFLMVRSLDDKSAGYGVWAIVPVLVLGTATRFTVGLFFLVAALFLPLAKGKALLKDRDWQISLALGFLLSLPFLFYFAALYGNPLYPFLSQEELRRAAGKGPGPGQVLLEYARYFPSYTNAVVTAVFAAGLVQATALLFRRGDRIQKDRALQAYLLLILWIALPFIFFALFVNHFEDRYPAMIFPAVFILTGAALDAAYAYLKKYSFAAAAAAVAVVLIYGVYAMAARSDALIKEQIPSFNGVRDAGLWIKAHTWPGDTVITASVPQNTYYSERATFAYPGNEFAFEELLQARKPKYMVLSMWEDSPEWTYDWPRTNEDRLSIASVLYMDAERKQPTAVVYAFHLQP
ncbi:MAG TPA: glycosyltransferase family 39 protein [Candidatus Binatia bacterium]